MFLKIKKCHCSIQCCFPRYQNKKLCCLDQDRGLITAFILVFLVYFIVISPTHPTSSPYWLVFSRLAAGMSPTFLSRVNGSHRAERAFSYVVVNPHFDLVRGERGDAFVLENVSWRLWGGDGSLHPTLRPQWAESHHVTETRAALELLRNWLMRSDMTQEDGVRRVRHGFSYSSQKQTLPPKWWPALSVLRPHHSPWQESPLELQDQSRTR